MLTCLLLGSLLGSFSVALLDFWLLSLALGAIGELEQYDRCEKICELNVELKQMLYCRKDGGEGR